MIPDFERISHSTDSCRKCGTVFSWTEGLLHAKEIGITSSVVACPKCHSAYVPTVVSGGMSLGKDVTKEYPQTTYQPSKLVQTAAAPPQKSPVLAAVLSFFLFGGAGQLYLGQWKKGLILIAAVLLLSDLFLSAPIGIIGILDAYGTAQKLNSGEKVTEWKFNVNWKVAGLLIGLYVIFMVGVFLLPSLNSSR